MPVLFVKFIKEIVILLVSLLVFPTVLIIVVIWTDSREILARGLGLGTDQTALWVRLISPYLVVQAIRGFLWSQRSLTGRKWANLYFSVFLAGIGGWSFWQAWDMFYFMYELGDIPGELRQFFELEADNLIVLVVCVIVSAHCLRIFLDPRKNAPSSLTG